MPTDATHVYRRAIRFADTDAAGVAHFSRLLPIVEEAVHDFFHKRGIAILDAANAWPVVSIRADYSSACRFGDEISLALCIDRIGKSSLAFSFEARDPSGSTCFAGAITLCHVNPSQHAPTPIPEKTRDALHPGHM